MLLLLLDSYIHKVPFEEIVRFTLHIVRVEDVDLER